LHSRATTRKRFVMTMQIDSRRTIGGISVLQLRRFFRHVVAHHHDSFDRECLLSYLQLSEPHADQLLEALASQSFISLDSSQNGLQYQLTEFAHELVRSSAAKRISRETAQHALEGLMSRVKEINSSPKYLYSVCSVVVFGGYLSHTGRLGDVDVAIELSSRTEDPNKRPEAHLRYARESGRQFGNFTDQLCWAETEVYQVLKARRRTISIQPWHSFVGMKKRADFQYEVLFGNADKIANDLKSAQKSHEDPRPASS
jgi:predicted nucleotidyltransferase